MHTLWLLVEWAGRTSDEKTFRGEDERFFCNDVYVVNQHSPGIPNLFPRDGSLPHILKAHMSKIPSQKAETLLLFIYTGLPPSLQSSISPDCQPCGSKMLLNFYLHTRTAEDCLLFLATSLQIFGLSREHRNRMKESAEPLCPLQTSLSSLLLLASKVRGCLCC